MTAPPSEGTGPSASARDTAANGDTTLLVVDDTDDARELLVRRLERRGYRVLATRDGEAALALVAHEPIDLVLLDLMMPGMDGLDVLRHLRAEPASADLPVIMQTARTDSESLVEALRLGANDYVTKPLDFPVAVARIDKELRQRRASRLTEAMAKSATVPSTTVPTATGQSSAASPSDVLAGRYRLLETLGSGNFGVVYRARHLELDTDLAIKVLHGRPADDPEALERFRAEGQSACRVRHPNAVAVHDFVATDDAVAFLVMELLDGRSLADEMRESGPLSLDRVAEIARPVCEVLAAAHEQAIVHRDVKPENIFLHRAGGRDVVKVLDFGIAKIFGRDMLDRRLTAEGFILGTPAYMAPERLRDERYDGRADVYSLGVVLYQLLTGELPYSTDARDPMALLMRHLHDPVPKPRAIAPNLPRRVDQLVRRAMAKRAADRPTPLEIAHELETAARRARRGGRAGAARSRSSRWSRRPGDGGRRQTVEVESDALTLHLSTDAVERPGSSWWARLRRWLGR